MWGGTGVLVPWRDGDGRPGGFVDAALIELHHVLVVVERDGALGPWLRETWPDLDVDRPLLPPRPWLLVEHPASRLRICRQRRSKRDRESSGCAIKDNDLHIEVSDSPNPQAQGPRGGSRISISCCRWSGLSQQQSTKMGADISHPKNTREPTVPTKRGFKVLSAPCLNGKIPFDTRKLAVTTLSLNIM